MTLALLGRTKEQVQVQLQEHTTQRLRFTEGRPPQLVEPLEAFMAGMFEVPRLRHREVHVLRLPEIP